MTGKKKHTETQIDTLISNAVKENQNLADVKNSPEFQSEMIENENNNKTSAKQNKVKKGKASFRDLIDGSILTREYVIDQMPFIFFLALIAMVYIGNRYDSEKMARDAVVIQNEIKELRCEKISIHSELDSLSKQSSVTKLIIEKNLTIKQLVEPPKKIVIPLNKTNITANK